MRWTECCTQHTGRENNPVSSEVNRSLEKTWQVKNQKHKPCIVGGQLHASPDFPPAPAPAVALLSKTFEFRINLPDSMPEAHLPAPAEKP